MNRLYAVLVTANFGISAAVLARPMTATLSLAERVPVGQLAADVNNPASAHYGVFYTPEELRAISAPSDADYAKLLKTLRTEGFAIVYESPSHLVVRIKADHTLFEKVFRAPLEFSANAVHTNLIRPRIPNELALVQNVTGFDNTPKFKPLYRKAIRNMDDSDDNAQPGVLPSQVKTAYQLNSLYNKGLTGEGQHIAIATYMDFELADVQQYYEHIGLSPVPNVDKVNFNGTAAYDGDSAMETELDAEVSGMIAPGANIHVFTSAENSDEAEIALFTAILDDNRAKVVNYSWGSCETIVDSDHFKAMDKVFARALAQGVNLLIASGDDGTDPCQDGSVAADWPAAHPNVVAVGGTTLTINDDGTSSETGWYGSGGGISKHYNLPSWQKALKKPFVRRSFPDVAFNADPASGEAIWVRQDQASEPAWQQIGGTSMASPQWVGFLTLVNEARVNNGLKTIGFLNPIIYQANTQTKKLIFNDIISGSNGAYSAGAGWDAVTGWGSMKGAEMLEYLLSH